MDGIQEFPNKSNFHMHIWAISEKKLKGSPHIWLEMYSFHYTLFLGYVACRVTSKPLNIETDEMPWSDVKKIKNRKRSNLIGDSHEKHAILYTLAQLEEIRVCSNHECCNNSEDKATYF